MLWLIRTSLIRKCDLNIQDQGHEEIMHTSVVILYISNICSDIVKSYICCNIVKKKNAFV